MSKPQQSELRRSEHNEALSPDATEGRQQARRSVDLHGADTFGPIPEDNLPGSGPADDQDKPDLGDFAEKFGVAAAQDRAPTGARESGNAADHSHQASEENRAGDAGSGARRDLRAMAGPPPLETRPPLSVSARVVTITSHLVLGPWIVAGRVAQAVQSTIDQRLAGETGRPTTGWSSERIDR